MLYYFASKDGQHSENAQEMTIREAIDHVRKVRRELDINLQVIRSKDGKVVYA